MTNSRYGHESTSQLYVLLSLARTKVQYGQTESSRRRAMEDVELIRSKLVRRNASPDGEAPACT
jgi:hypothetical protein